MSFEDEEDPVLFERPESQIVITTCGGEVIDTIDLPALALRRSEVSPAWLALYDAEQEAQRNG